MERIRRTAAIAAAALVAIGAGQAAAGGGPHDFKAIAKIVDAKTKGDAAIFKERLKVGGKKAGKAKIKLRFGEGWIRFSGTWHLEGGAVKAKDKLEGKHDRTVKIVGGSGAYDGARGTVTIKPVTNKRNRESFQFAQPQQIDR